MRLLCPACATAYDAPDAAMTPGRVVRCARCGHEWAPVNMPAAPEPAAAPMRPVEAVPPPRPAGPAGGGARLVPPAPARRRAGGGAWLAWIASLVLLGAIAWGLVAWREQVMAAWPPSQRAYAALGLTPASTPAPAPKATPKQ